jgi:cell division transport system permease protein
MAAKKIFQKYRYDIALESGAGAHLVAWVTGLMVFFMTLAFAVNIGLANVTENWVSGLSGSLTVELRVPAQKDESGKTASAEKAALDKKIAGIVALGGKHESVVSARALENAEVRKLIEPWLGSAMPADLPLPALIDLKIKPDADIAALTKDILEIAPEATVDTHDDTLKDITTLVNTARIFVLMLSSVIMLLAVVAISGIVRAKLAIHHHEVETLHMIGAHDEYIARQFRHHTLKGTLKGAAAGVAAMLGTLYAVGRMTERIDSAILPDITLAPLEWAVLVAAPVLIGTMIAHFTAQTTVLGALRRLG